MNWNEFAWWIHFAATLFMVGLIWIVQLVHYPLMSYVSEDRFAAFEAAHQSRISIIVMPVMLTEFALAFYLYLIPPTGISKSMMLLCGLMLIGIWLSTFLLQVPMHNKLSNGFDHTAHRFLVGTNWIRTILWTTRVAVLICLTTGWSRNLSENVTMIR